jgi:MEDS: MEthanogen/methylotroph, DcmR Sensory domain/STAS domain
MTYSHCSTTQRSFPSGSLWDAEPGTHLCVLYQGEAELEQAAATFVNSGLAGGDRVLYMASERPSATVRTALEAHQVPAGAASAIGQLVIEDFGAACGQPGQLALAQLESAFRAAARKARADGFGALRVATEMGHFSRAIGSVEQLLEWERICTPIQHEEGITSVCQYDQRGFSDTHAAMIVREHAGIAPDRLPVPPTRFTATTAPWGLTVSGELDLASRGVFSRVLRARLGASPWLRLDVGGLVYAEAAALAVVYEAASRLEGAGCIVVTRAPAQLRRIVGLAGFSHPRVVID